MVTWILRDHQRSVGQVEHRVWASLRGVQGLHVHESRRAQRGWSMAGVDRKPRGRPSPFFEGWAREYAWPERARAHDAHLDRIRERSIEKAIEEEAEKQAREVERTRYRFNELMALSFEGAMEWFEHAQPSDLRAQDVIGIIK